MTDLVERLQSEFIALDEQRKIRQEAATEIERLQAALQKIRDMPMNRNAPAALGLCQREASKALKEQT